MKKRILWWFNKIYYSIPVPLLYFKLNYYLGILLHIFFKGDYKNVDLDIKSVAFVFSQKHFSENNTKEDRKMGRHNVTNVARTIYNFLCKKYKVYYLGTEEDIEIPQVDMVIGIMSKNYIKVCRNNKNSKKVLLLMNSCPFFRAKRLILEAKRLSRYLNLERGEWVSLPQYIKNLVVTNEMILLGNEFIKSTYTYIPKNFIKTFNAPIDTNFFKPDIQKKGDKIRVLYVASDLGLRKGLWRLFDTWTNVDTSKMELVIVGGIGKSMKYYLDDFISKHDNVVYKGWIESYTNEYRDILQSSHIVLMLSLEEGQVGTVLEAMACGAVPIITENCGISIEDKKEGLITETDPVDYHFEYVIKNIDSMTKNSVDFIKNNNTDKSLLDVMSNV